jgi:hypothetical protein
VDFETLLKGTHLPSVDLPAIAAIEGWLTEEAIDLTMRLAQLQLALGHAGGILELGVFKGKYLSLLASLFQDAGVPAVGVDAFLARLGEPVEPCWQEAAKAQILQTVAGLAPRSIPPVLLAGFTRDIEPAALRAIVPNGFGFISVDAGHEAPDVEHDLGLVEAVMTDQAIVALDDVFHPRVPGVVEGLCRYFFRHPESVLRPFAICGNKVFFCAGSMHTTYLEYTRWILGDAQALPYVRKSAVSQEQDRTANFTPRFLGHEVAVFFSVFLWN